MKINTTVNFSNQSFNKYNNQQTAKHNNCVSSPSFTHNDKELPNFAYLTVANTSGSIRQLQSLNDKYPKSFSAVVSAKTTDNAGNEVHRFNYDDIARIMYQVDTTVTREANRLEAGGFNSTDMANESVGIFVERLVGYKDKTPDNREKPRFSSSQIASLLDLYSIEDSAILKKVIDEKTTDNPSSEYKFSGNTIPSIVRTIKKSSDLEEEILDKDYVPSYSVLRAFIKPTEGETLNLKKLEIIKGLSDFKTIDNLPLISDASLLNAGTIRAINKLEEKHLPVVKHFTSEYEVSFETASNLAKGLEKNPPEDIKVIDRLLDNHIYIENYAQTEKFLKTDKKEQESIFKQLEDRKPFFEKTCVRATALDKNIGKKIDYIENTPILRNYIYDDYRNLIFTDGRITSDAVKNGVRLAQLTPERFSKKDFKAVNNSFGLGICESMGWISKDFVDEYVKTLDKIAQTDEKNFDALKNIFVDNFYEVYDSQKIGDASSNIDYFKDKDISCYYSTELNPLLFASGVNLSEQRTKLDKIIENNQEEIEQEISTRCKDIPPFYGDDVIGILETPKDAEQLLLMNDLSKEAIIETSCMLAQLGAHVLKNPEKYVNGEYSANVLEVATADLNKKPVSRRLYISPQEALTIDSVKDEIEDNIYSRKPQIMVALGATDLETVTLLLNKRFIGFNNEIDKIQTLSTDNKKLLSNLIKHGQTVDENGTPKKLTGAQKLEVVDLINLKEYTEQNLGKQFDLEKYIKPSKENDETNLTIDFKAIRNNLISNVLVKNGVSKKEIPNLKQENLNWDMSYITLLDGNTPKNNTEMALVIKNASEGNFEQFINDSNNIYGKANTTTKDSFNQAKLNYDAWEKGIEGHSFKIGCEEFTIKTWDRNPQKSIFNSKKANDCTAPDDIQGDSSAKYLLNKAINIVEVKDSEDNVVGISRCFVGNVKGKNAVIIDNIDINKGFSNVLFKNDAEKQYLEDLTGYICDWASQIGGKKMPVYLSSSSPKFKDDILDEKYERTIANITMTGDIANDKMYLNTFGDSVNTKKLSDIDANLFVVRA